jgi:hypothetical protein
MGGQVRLHGAPTRGGRIGLHITGDSVGHFAVNISLPEDFTWPVGGLVLRLRTPAFPAKKISSATVGGKAVAAHAINATDETIAFLHATAGLDSMQVTLA